MTSHRHHLKRSEAAEARIIAQLLTRSEAAAGLSVSLRTIDNLVASGDLPAVKIGRAIRIRPSALDYFIEARESRQSIRRKGGRK
jgi:excisionase family DNA binding protein